MISGEAECGLQQFKRALVIAAAGEGSKIIGFALALHGMGLAMLLPPYLKKKM